MSSFFDESENVGGAVATRLVDGVATAFKVSLYHSMKSEVGFSITPDNLVRAEWKRTCPGIMCEDPAVCRHFVGCKYRSITTATKKLQSFDIGTTWMLILGITPKRKFDINAKRYVGLWTNKDWKQLKHDTQPMFKPHMHVQVYFLHPKDFTPLHENPIRIRLDGTFGTSFERRLQGVASVVIPKARSLLSVLTDKDQILAHVPLNAEMVQCTVKSSKADVSSRACSVRGFRYTTDLKDSVIMTNTDLSALISEKVRETREWIESIEDQLDQVNEEYVEFDGPVQDPMISAEQADLILKARNVMSGGSPPMAVGNGAADDQSPSCKKPKLQ